MNQVYIRNFAIIAHVDAGKSTLSDRLMEITGTVAKKDHQEQMLDSNPIERERGVTIKLAPVTMRYRLPTTDYRLPTTARTVVSSQLAVDDLAFMLNLIDTPGHVDFSYEVERALAACEGAILLIDGTRGIQAQTLSHFQKAKKIGLKIIPVINKIDLPATDTNLITLQLNEVLGFSPSDVLFISAKTGAGVEKLLEKIIGIIPAPYGNPLSPLRALIFNSVYDEYLGVVAFIKVVDGVVHSNESLFTYQSQIKISPKEIGIFVPDRQKIDKLQTGQVGYIATGLKDIHKIKVGETITSNKPIYKYTNKPINQCQNIIPLPGYREPKPMVFADVYPASGQTYQNLQEAVEKLKLSDASLAAEPIHSPALGAGLRLGFLGLFHIEITKERLFREHDMETVFTSPTVEYHLRLTNGRTLFIRNPSQMPDPSLIGEIKEPIVKLIVITPPEYLGNLIRLLEENRGNYQTTLYLNKVIQLIYKLPLSELISGLVDKIKSVSRGFATIDYEPMEMEKISAVKLEIYLNHEAIEPLSRIVVSDRAAGIGRQMVEKLKEILPSQMFAIPIQAAVGGNILARETKKAFRKDVTAKLYGGDQTRKDKLLKKQKKGKKKMALLGRVRVPENVFMEMMKNSS